MELKNLQSSNLRKSHSEKRPRYMKISLSFFARSKQVHGGAWCTNFHTLSTIRIVSQPRSQGPLSTSRSRERTLGTRLKSIIGGQAWRFPLFTQFGLVQRACLLLTAIWKQRMSEVMFPFEHHLLPPYRLRLFMGLFFSFLSNPELFLFKNGSFSCSNANRILVRTTMSFCFVQVHLKFI